MVVKKVWESLDQPGRLWRVVFKGLSLLDHLIKNGAERFVEEARDHMHKIRSLQYTAYVSLQTQMKIQNGVYQMDYSQLLYESITCWDGSIVGSLY